MSNLSDTLNSPVSSDQPTVDNSKSDKISAALSLPTVATYNLRSMFPKIGNLTADILERKVDVSFLQEIWEDPSNPEHRIEIEKLLEISGLKYFSTARPPNAKNGVSYGGAAIIVNLEKFTVDKLDVHIPNNLEVVWGLLKPKNPSAKFKKIVICSFYSPPNKRRNTKMADHIVSTLQMLTAKYPECGIILGADRNYMDIKPILSCGLRLRQVVDQNTRHGAILDIIIMNTNCYFNSPFIAPPIKPDNPLKGKPSDHWVPVCVPHTDRYSPPSRNYKVIKYRPLPESSLRRFGEWIVSQGWESLDSNLSPTEQASAFEQVMVENLNIFCPEKSMKISSQDKAFITKELKTIHRQKGREYAKRGKSQKYKNLAAKFEEIYKTEAEKYLRKNVDALLQTNPGQAYKILKRMGAQPGDCGDTNTFTLPSHESENLTDEESAERLANYFASISQEYPPFDINCLPAHVQTQLETDISPPLISEYDTYLKIMSAKKPQSGVPGDMPRTIINEFAPELATPASKIINNIVQSCEWPAQWKLEYVTVICKIPVPEQKTISAQSRSLLTLVIR